ncbi:MAG: GntR family transcriptional regulator [Clostridiaceae bacterium]
MDFSNDSIKPIYMQISEWIEDEILKENIKEEQQILSKNQFASIYKINPATANKGINILAEEGILYKKRGIGMFVSIGARNKILTKRKKRFIEEYVDKLLFEGEKLGMNKEEIIDTIKNR